MENLDVKNSHQKDKMKSEKIKKTVKSKTSKTALNSAVKTKKSVSNPVESTKALLSANTLPIKSKMTSIWKKIKNPKIFIPLIVLLVLILAAIFGQRLFFVAYVNGQPITRMAYYNALEQKDGSTVMQNLVMESLINQEASKRGIVVTNADVQKAEKNIEQQLSSQGQSLDSVLTSQGLTMAEFEDQLRVQQQVEKLLGNKINVTSKQIDDYIAQNKNSLPTTATGSALRAEVKQQLQQEQLTVAFQSFIANLEKNAHITYFTSYK